LFSSQFLHWTENYVKIKIYISKQIMAGTDVLNYEIQESQTAADIKAKTLEILADAETIKDFSWSEEVKKEYEEVRLATIWALKDLRIQTASELDSIKKSLGTGDMDSLSNGVISQDEYTKIETQFKELTSIHENTAWTKLPPELKAVADKDFTEFTPEQAQKMLQFLQGDYTKYTSISRSELIWWGTYAACQTQEQVNIGQEILINKIYGEGVAANGFSGENLIGFSEDEGGNYIINAHEFEQKLKDGHEINPKVFASYVNSAENRCGWDTEKFKIEVSRYLGSRKEKIDAFLWTPKDQNVLLAKEKLTTLWVFQEEAWLIDWFLKQLQIDMDTSYLKIEEKVISYTSLDSIDKEISTYKRLWEEAKKERREVSLKESSSFIVVNKEVLFDKSVGEDITHIQNSEVQEAVLFRRKEDFSKRSLELKGQVEANFWPLFQESPEILSYIKESLDSKNPKEINPEAFIAKIESLIQAHNKKYENAPEKQIPELSKETWTSFITSVNDTKGLDLRRAYTENTKKLSSLSEKIRMLGIKQEKLKETMSRSSEIGVIELKRQEKELKTEEAQAKVDLQKVTEKQAEIIDTQTSVNVTKIVIETAAKSEKGNLPLALWEARKDAEVKERIQKIQKIAISKKADIASVNHMIQSGNIQEATVKIAEIQKQDNLSYMGEEWDTDITQAQMSHKKAMIASYGQNWEETVPLPPKNTETKPYSEDWRSESWTSAAYIETQGDFPVIIMNGGNTSIPITPEERKIAENNPEALQNMIDFYDFFKSLNLESVWEYRSDLIKIMKNNGVSINVEDDSIDSAELVAFGNWFIKIVNGIVPPGEELHEKPASIFALKAELRKFSQSGNIMSQNKDFNKLWEDRFEALMRKYGVIGGVIFKTDNLKLAMQEKRRYRSES
jgi:hypothetical protein